MPDGTRAPAGGDKREEAKSRRVGERRAADERRAEERRNAAAGGRRESDERADWRDSQCNGICILHDTHSCDGCSCSRCEAAAAGLCARRVAAARSRQHKPGGPHAAQQVMPGDYRLVGAKFIKRLGDDPEYDEDFRSRLARGAMRAAKDAAAIEAQLDGPIADPPELGRILDKFPGAPPDPAQFGMQVLLFIYRSHRCDIGVDVVADRLALDRLDLNNAVRAYFGVSYPTLLSSVRIEHAKRYLDTEELRISEVAQLAGYGSINSFSVSFKRLEGVSPKEHRARNASKPCGDSGQSSENPPQAL